ncbi:soluble lytic murein transglycosylase [Rubricella aquisinus]|uniref:Soluble lytic murein transglycosylase n=1 Tax=Rubricella aquisinus TaxID=2028108 RepID=A0A840X2V9_9RHOB|nr:lytic transglycosylase domain-containing protein [Rubricella aquisinus]MBB5517184.1 soluble lytic murein transglycosylase [Rubricella aquisinus]
MRGRAWIAGLCALIVTGASGPARAELPPSPVLTLAFEAVDDSDWVSAFTLAERLNDPAAVDLIQWHRLRDGQGAWWEYIDFLSTHPDWPGLSRLRREGERQLPAGEHPVVVTAYFEGDAPATGNGALRLANAQAALGQTDQARDTITAAWRTLSLDAEEKSAILSQWGTVLQTHHWARTDHLIWEGQMRDAEAMLPLLSPDYRALATARISLRRTENGVNALIDRIPAALQSDPGLAHDRMVWRMRKGNWDGAREMVLASSESAATLGRPEAWGDRRRSLARSAMRSGDITDAYRLAANHHMTVGYGRADMEWFAGWVQLRKFRQPDRAIPHFERFLSMVETPISVARGAYWLGRAEEARGRTTAAREMYALAGQHQTTFYGQLAAERGGIAVDTSIIGTRQGVNWQGASFVGSPLLHLANLAHQGGDWITAELFLTRIALDLQNPAEQELLAQYAIDQFGRADTAVRLSKQAAGDGLVFPNTAYPVTELASFQSRVPVEIVKSLARQESELNPEAISHAGARGLMQVMPATAQGISRRLGLPYAESRLTEDWQYNATLGSDYLGDLLDEFRGSIVLSAIGYNAGRSRAYQWMERYGDPRRMSPDEVIDWIETIPFNETRNYVQRVVEGMHVYRQRLTGQAVPLQINADITRG